MGRQIMKLRTIGLLVLGASVLVLASTSTAAAAGGKKKKGPGTAKKLEDVALIGELRKTAHLLSKADRDYKGHRAAAVKQIKLAIGDLRREAKVRGHKIPDGYKGPEPQPVSDAQLKKAVERLKTILGQINSLKATKNRELAAEHITRAIDELKVALTIA
jgi:hypothetical protein